MPVSFIPMSSFQPDGGEHGQGLSIAKNVLPVHGSFRTHNKKSQMATVAAGPCRGAYVHVYQTVTSAQFSRPDSDSAPGAWVTAANGTTNLYQRIDEEVPLDADFIIVGNAPTAQAVKIGLSNVTDPASAVDHYLRWRYRVPVTSGAWTLVAELMEGAAVISTDTVVSTGVTGWVEREDLLAAGEANAITDYTNLFVRFTATVAGAAQFGRPISDVSVGSWTTQAGGSTNLYQTIDEAVAADADFVQSPSLLPGGAAYTYTAGITALVDPLLHDVADDFRFRFRYRGRNAGVTLTARLKQGAITIADNTIAAISTSFTDGVLELDTDEVAAITDWASLRLEFEASYPSDVASTATQKARPDDTNDAGGWTAVPAGSHHLRLDEVAADDADYISANDATAITLRLSDILDPNTSAGHVLRVRAGFALNRTLRMELLEGASVVATSDITLTGAHATYTYTLTAAEANNITNYTNLLVRFTSVEGVSMELTWFEFEVPEPRRAEISFAEFQTPSASRAEVSFAEFRVPDANTTYKGDVATLFAGSLTKLYEVTAAAFNDKSIAANYGGGTVTAAGWSFCSFGNHVIATNYTDPVQYRPLNAGLFANLITSVDQPKARFCASVRNHLMLADINFTGHTPDEVWWSAFNDVRDFQKSFQTQADYQPIVSCPGQIMGLVGGDFALVFKRRSIHRLDWIGGRAVFRVGDVSSSIGTPFPRSIVSAHGYVYFWDGSQFRKTTGYEPVPMAMGTSELSNFLTDTVFSDNALIQREPANPVDEDQFMVGAMDPASGCIFWSYQGKSDSASRHDRFLVYNPFDDRWALGQDASFDISYLVQRPNVMNSDTFLTKGLVGFDWDGTNMTWFRFSQGVTYEATLSTKRVAIGFDENDRPTEVRVKGVLPVFTALPKTDYPPITITVRACNEPMFITNEKTETYDYTKRSTDENWFPHDVSGYWFKFEATVPALTDEMVVAFKGFWVDWEYRGRK